MARVIISGMSGLKKKLSSMSAKVQKEVKLQVLDSSTTIQMNAISAAPAGLKGRIDSTPSNNGFAAEVGVQSSTNIPVYIEFGTGASAASYVPTLPQEIQEYALMFKTQTPGRMMKQPYLIPAFLRESPIFIKELEKILKKNA
jgi:hypothetical protein